MVGRRVTLRDGGEGWFAGYADISGTIQFLMQSNTDDNPYYIVRLDTPLELQEPGAATPSGFILRRYLHCVVHCRWQSTDINIDAPVPVHVLLLPPGSGLPKSNADLAATEISAWADCVAYDGWTYEGSQPPRSSPRGGQGKEPRTSVPPFLRVDPFPPYSPTAPLIPRAVASITARGSKAADRLATKSAAPGRYRHGLRTNTPVESGQAGCPGSRRARLPAPR